MTTIGEIQDESLSPSANYWMETEDPGVKSYKMKWSTIVSTISDVTIAGLSDVAVSGLYSDLSGTPVLATVATSGLYSDLSGKPSFSAVAISGAYSDLLGKPTLATVATTGLYSSLTGTPSLATVATSGLYTDLGSRPTLSPVATGGLFTNLTDVPSTYSGQANKYVRVNPDGTALIFDTVATSTGGHAIQDEGVDRTARSKLNFIGATVDVTDDAVNDRTNVTISSEGSSLTDTQLNTITLMLAS